jgi:hypothetical protein
VVGATVVGASVVGAAVVGASVVGDSVVGVAEDVDLNVDEDEDEDEATTAELVVDVDDSAAPHVLHIPGHAARNNFAISASLA